MHCLGLRNGWGRARILDESYILIWSGDLVGILRQIAVTEMAVGEMTVGEMAVSEMAVGVMAVGVMAVGGWCTLCDNSIAPQLNMFFAHRSSCPDLVMLHPPK